MSLNNLTTYNPLTINGLDGLNINGSPFDPTNYISKIDPNIQTISGSLDAGLNKIKSGASPSGSDDLTNKLYVDTQNNSQDIVIATKASTTYVDTQNNAQDLVIATKASTTYVDTQNNAQDLVIATKASTTYVDTSISNLASAVANTYLDKITGSTQTMNGELNAPAFTASGRLAVWNGSSQFYNARVEISGEDYVIQRDDSVSAIEDILRYDLSLNKWLYPEQIASRVAIFDIDKGLVSSTTSTTTLTYLDIGSSLVGLLGAKANLTGGNTFSGDQVINSGSLSISSRFLGTPDASLSGNFWMGLRGTGSEPDRLAISINGNQTTGVVGFVSIPKTLNLPYITSARVLVIDGSQNVQASTVSTTTLGFLDATSSVQNQLNAKANLAGGNTFTGFQTFSDETASRVAVFDVIKRLRASTTTMLELSYLSGTTSSVQPQLDTRVLKTGDEMTGALTIKLGVLANYLTCNNTNLTVNSSITQRFAFGNLAGAQRSAYIQALLTTGNATNLLFYTDSGFNADTERMRITGAGNIGIGSTDPKCSLYNYAAGTSGWKGQSYFGNETTGVIAGTFNNVAYLGGHNAALNAWTDIALAPGGNCGIGTTTPGAKLHVVGDFQLSGNVGIGTVPSGTRALRISRAYTADSDWSSMLSFENTAVGAAYTEWEAGPNVFNGKSRFTIRGGTNNFNTLLNYFNLDSDGRATFLGLLGVSAGNSYAIPNNHMTTGSLTIGDNSLNYGGGTTGWNTNTAGFMMECLDNTEIAVHDAGNRVASFMYFQGGPVNTFTIGRDMFWGLTPLIVASRLQCNGNVGIGTTNPATALHIARSFTANADYSGMISFENTAVGYFEWQLGPQVISNNAAFSLRGGTDGFGSLVDMLTVIGSGTGIFGLGTNRPDQNWAGNTIPNNKLSILGGTSGLAGGIARLSIGADNKHYSAIEAQHIGSGSTTLSLMTTESVSVNGSNPLTRLFISEFGKVGINTTSPSAPLTVNGSITIKSANGVYEPGCILSDANWGMLMRGAVAPVAAHFAWFSSAGNELMRIATSGVVGIGTNAPGAMVDIYNTTADYTNSLLVRTPWASVTLDNTQIGGGRKWSLLSGGLGAGVGVGNFGLFDITGSSYRFAVDSTGRISLGNNNAHTRVGVMGGNTSGDVQNTPSWPSNANGILISSSGSQGGNTGGLYTGYQNTTGYITCLAPSVSWDNLYISAGITYISYYGTVVAYSSTGGIVNISDEREKEDIQPLKTDKSLERILALKPKHYRRKYYDSATPVDDAIKERRHVGFIAQEVQKTNPHCISSWCNKDAVKKRDEAKVEIDVDEEDVKVEISIEEEEDDGLRFGMSYNDYVVHLVGGMQEQQKQLETMSQRCAILEERNQILEEHARKQEKDLQEYQRTNDLNILKMASLISQLLKK